LAATLSVAAACLLLGAPLHAQDEDRSDSREGQNRQRENYAFSVGVGLADVDSVAETYLTAALRIRATGRTPRNDSDSSQDWRGRPPENQGLTGYFEPEIGYWKASGKNGTGSDLLLGVNLIGVVPLGSVDTYLGAGVGVHRLDAELLSNPTSDSKQTKIGVNAQFGLDVYMTRSWSFFGTGRFDIVQDARKSIQAKAFLGIRTRF
jgi:opacity protein-like surface antigen